MRHLIPIYKILLSLKSDILYLMQLLLNGNKKAELFVMSDSCLGEVIIAYSMQSKTEAWLVTYNDRGGLVIG